MLLGRFFSGLLVYLHGCMVAEAAANLAWSAAAIQKRLHRSKICLQQQLESIL
jgi:DNA-directed RNA polymerase specialized sigma24 family protein